MLRNVVAAASLLLLLVWMTGCTADSAETPPEPTTETPPPTDAAMTRPGIDLPTLIRRVDERAITGRLLVLGEMNPPMEVRHEPVQNRHDPGQTDTLRTLIWAGLKMVVYDVSGAGNELVQEVEVTGTDYETEEGVGVGDTRAAVREALGEPDTTEGSTMVYERPRIPDDPTPAQLYLRFDGDYVQAMTWQFYVD